MLRPSYDAAGVTPYYRGAPHVRVRRTGSGFAVSLGDRTYRVDASAARAGLNSLRIDGEQHEVETFKNLRQWVPRVR